MKEILIVDVDYWNNKHLCNSCPIWNDEKYSCQYDRNTGNKGCPLKPLPSKKVSAFDPNSASYDEERERSIMNEIDGYNRCLDEIMGEAE